MVKKVLVGYGVDIDAVAGWLGSYGGEDSTSDISRGQLEFLFTPQLSRIYYSGTITHLRLGLFAGTIGVRRLLKLFEKNNIKATWFM